jgi:hypothetical protein
MFNMPEIKVIAFQVEDIITVSGEAFNPGAGGVGGGDDM